MKRRDFFRNTLLGGGLTLTGLSTLTSCKTILKESETTRAPAEDANGNRKTYRMRYEASSKEAIPHIQAYEIAIGKMQKNSQFLGSNRKLGNGLNWMRQAQIHLDHCPHGSWAFFPWHREYLYRFEEIIREVSGFEDFCLPFWDWSVNFNLPAICKDKKQTFFMNENSRKSDVSHMVEEQTNLKIVKKSLAVKDFVAFMGSSDGSGEVEYGPHNGVHVALGGTMGTFKSPMDPVFWMHHCNVDRLWAIWQEANPQWIKTEEIKDKFPKWLPLPLAGFYDRKGQSIEQPRLAQDVLDTFAEPLRYCYPETVPDLSGKRNKSRIPAAEERTKLKVRAFTREDIQFKMSRLLTAQNTYQFQLPDFKGNVGSMLDDYLVNPSKYEKFYFRLRTEGFPRLASGTSLKISLMLEGSNDIFITNYSFFNSTMQESAIAGLVTLPANSKAQAARHAHHQSDTIPKFYFDFEKVLIELKNKFISNYPEPTNFKVEFINTATKTSQVLDPKVFDELHFKLIVLERVGLGIASDASDSENQD